MLANQVTNTRLHKSYTIPNGLTIVQQEILKYAIESYGFLMTGSYTFKELAETIPAHYDSESPRTQVVIKTLLRADDLSKA